MHKILFITALSQELKYIKKEIKKLKIPDLKVDFFTTWMWNYNTILNLTKNLSTKKYDFIVNIGSAWYFWKNKIKNIYQIARIKNLENNKEELVPINFKLHNLATYLSSETPVSNIEQISIQEDFYLIDMESYWFELVGNNFNIPRLILKIPVDKIWKKFDSNIFIKKVEEIDFNYILINILEYLKSLTEKEDLSYYFEYFKFTFSEKLIFERLYHKYQALHWNFTVFFEANKMLDKKKFLEILKK